MLNHSVKSENPVGETSPKDRRQWERFPLRDAHGLISWERDGQADATHVVVDNISGGGVAVITDELPDDIQQVWLRLDCVLKRTPAWSCVVAGLSKQRNGKCLLRLRFTHWIPLDTVLEKHRERRGWQRYPANEIKVSLTWQELERMVTINGELANMSGGGAAVITNVHPPSNRAMWLELLDNSQRIEPVEVRLVVFSNDPSGVKIARFSFAGACPLQLFDICKDGIAEG